MERGSEGTLDGMLNGVKLTLLQYQYPLLFSPVSFQGVSLADARDIACMKLDAISSRGSRKDFVDMFVLLEHYSLKEILNWFSKKYAHIEYNRLHLLKNLVYFNDAEHEPMPKMLIDVTWPEITARLIQETRNILDNEEA